MLFMRDRDRLTVTDYCHYIADHGVQQTDKSKLLFMPLSKVKRNGIKLRSPLPESKYYHYFPEFFDAVHTLSPIHYLAASSEVIITGLTHNTDAGKCSILAVFTSLRAHIASALCTPPRTRSIYLINKSKEQHHELRIS